MTTLICDCNKTMPLDGPALRRALGPEAGAGLETVHSTLCRREAGAFQRAAKGGEHAARRLHPGERLFLELNEETEGAASVAERPIRFVNIREIGRLVEGRARRRMPKMAALIAAAQLPPAEPVPLVSYRSRGPRAGDRRGRCRPARGPHARRQARGHACCCRGPAAACRRSGRWRSMPAA